ncbi:MAG: hypothetical protein ACI9JN_002116 [Bacteroidia bacterium]|jgi:hypothetical protein
MNVIELFRNDLWNGIWQHTKKLLKPMLTPTVVVAVLSMGVFYVAYLLIKPILPPEIFGGGAMTDPEEMAQLMLKITEAITENLVEFMGKIFIVTLLGAVLSSWYYNYALLISQRVAEDNPEDAGKPINSFGPSFIRVLGYGILLAVISTVVSVIVNYLQSFMPAIASLINLAIQLFLLRLFAGRAWIVLGNQTVMDGLKLSWEHITFVRALKLALIMIVGFLAISLGLGLVFGLSMLIGKAGIMIAMLALVVVMYVVSVVGVAGLSASFYRYVEVEYEEDASAPANHIIDTEE